jgi:tRNA (guanosine-2'-O-)-methyltransferase
MSRPIPSTLAALVLAACAAKAPAPKAPQAQPQGPERSGQASALHQGVSTVQSSCKAGSAEACNALDDDCDGVIDDGCGYSGGGVQVTVAWDSGADIDLYVRDPSGESVFYNNDKRRSPVGGFLDHTARGQCRPGEAASNVENAYWPEPAPTGTYVVELHYFGPCGQAAETQVTLSVAVHGRVVGVYRYTLKPEERTDAVTFEVR